MARSVEPADMIGPGDGPSPSGARSSDAAGRRDGKASGYPVGKAAAFALIVVAWVALDQWTKSLVADAQVGQRIAGLPGGLVDFVLVHNTGGAWGVLSGSTVALGVFSCVVCAVLVAYFLGSARSLNRAQTLGIALVVAGGIGNAIDRFSQGYVTDFIAVTFIDFPVFNIADIGVTCGVVILLAGMLLSWRSASRQGEARGGGVR